MLWKGILTFFGWFSVRLCCMPRHVFLAVGSLGLADHTGVPLVEEALADACFKTMVKVVSRLNHRGFGSRVEVARQPAPDLATYRYRTNDTTATRPTRTITARSALGGNLRPTVAPIWPPMTAPIAIRPATAQLTLPTAPSGR